MKEKIEGREKGGIEKKMHTWGSKQARSCREGMDMMEEPRPILNGQGSHTDQEITQENPIELELTEVIGISKSVENDNEIQWNDFLILGSMLIRNASTFSALRTPKLGNTLLHKAAWHGNDDYVDKIVRESPNLLFELNANRDTPLHLAARGHQIYTIEKLLAAYADFRSPEIAMAWLKYTNSSKAVEDYDAEMNMEDLLGLVKMENNQGNTMLHEAIYGNHFLCLVSVFIAFANYNIRDRKGESLAESCYKYALDIVNDAKQSVLYLAVEAEDYFGVELVLSKCPEIVELKGLSPFVAAIMKQDEGMLQMILDKRPEWIHLTEENGRIPLHYAALIGDLERVCLIIDKCRCCAFRSDKDGYFPIHLAAYAGHVKVIEVLLHYCSDPTEMLDNYQRNILHIAAKYGNHAVVHYILNNTNHVEMIHQKDCNGDTPLHLATRYCHPKIVYYFTCDHRVDLNSVNFNKQTPLDIIYELYQLKGNPSKIETGPILPYQLEKGTVEHLVWVALKSAGAKQHSRVLPVGSRQKKKVSNPEGYSNKIENLTVISTLIITASVAACLAVPGEADGRAHNLKKLMFQVFIICITVSLFSSIGATIILLWARIGLTELVIYCINYVLRLMGIALLSLSLAFMAGLYTVVSELTWLAYVFLGLCLIFIVVGTLLYSLLILPSASTNKFKRWISYYPFIILATLAEPNRKH